MNFRSAAEIVYPHIVALCSVPKPYFDVPKENPEFMAGTGMLLGTSNYILTAKHVVPPPNWKMLVGINPPEKVPEMTWTNFEVSAQFPQHDLAIIRAPELNVSFLERIRRLKFSYDIPGYGVPLGSFGYPQPIIEIDSTIRRFGVGMVLKFKSFYVAAIHRDPDTSYIALDSFAYGGHSGGPVFDFEGKILALIVRRELDTFGKIQISYSQASLLKNIQKELQTFLK
jgi:hypothetical protein